MRAITEIDRLIEEGERIISEQKHPDARARIIQMADEYRNISLKFTGADISEDPVFGNLTENLDTMFSRIIDSLESVKRELNIASHRESRPGHVHDFFWSLWAFWHEELGFGPEFKENKRLTLYFPVTREMMFAVNMPTGFEQWSLKCLKYIERAYRTVYEPDVDRPIETTVYAIYAAIYAIALHRLEESFDGSYSEEVRWAFQESFKAYFSVYKSIGGGKDHHDVEGLCALRDTEVQVTLGIHLFEIKVWDRDWCDALCMYAHTMGCFSNAALATYEIDSRTPVEKFWDDSEQGLHEKAQTVFDHIRELPQPAGDGLWMEIAEHVDLIIKSIERYWGDDDAALLSYWTGARWWLRGAKLELNQMRDELRKEEDAKAEQRLKNYFFNKYQWDALSQRARQALVDADRLWFAHRLGASDAPLIHIHMATEDIIWDLFDCDIAGFESKRQCNDLKIDEFNKDECFFITTLLPCYLKRLTRKRNSAVHSAGKPALEEERDVSELFNEFMGIGCDGVLSRLVNLRIKLFPNKRLPK